MHPSGSRFNGSAFQFSSSSSSFASNRHRRYDTRGRAAKSGPRCESGKVIVSKSRLIDPARSLCVVCGGSGSRSCPSLVFLRLRHFIESSSMTRATSEWRADWIEFRSRRSSCGFTRLLMSSPPRVMCGGIPNGSVSEKHFLRTAYRPLRSYRRQQICRFQVFPPLTPAFRGNVRDYRDLDVFVLQSLLSRSLRGCPSGDETRSQDVQSATPASARVKQLCDQTTR